MAETDADARAFEQTVRCIPTKIIMEKLTEGEKSLSDLENSLNEVAGEEPLDPLVVKLYLEQLEAEGFVERRGNNTYTATEKWKRLLKERGS